MRRSTRAVVVTFGTVAVVVAGGLSAAAFAGTAKPRPVPSAVPASAGPASAVPASRDTAGTDPACAMWSIRTPT